MVKITSIAFFLAATVASLTGAAPIALTPSAHTDNVATAIPSPMNNSTKAPLPVKTMSAKSADATVGILNANDPFSSSIKHWGKATWFTHNYGACNIYWNGYNEPVVAMNAHQMGAMSWGNPVCNRRVRITNINDPSKSVEARVVDKCPGDECAWGSLDLSPFAFQKLGHLDTGVLSITWNWI